MSEPMPQITCTILSDNLDPAGRSQPHGFAALLTVGERHLLLDTGPGEGLVENAHACGVDLAMVDWLVLSHGHDDHTGGLSGFLAVNQKARVLFHPSIAVDRYSARQTVHRISMPAVAARMLGALPAERQCQVTTDVHLDQGVGVSPILKRCVRDDIPGGPYFLDRTCAVPDPFADELVVWVRTAAGLVILTGCCHAGLANTVTAACRASRCTDVHAILGGLHLGRASVESREGVRTTLRDVSPRLVVGCHCTGNALADLDLGASICTQAGYMGLRQSFP